MILMDIKEMPGFNAAVPNGTRSVSDGKVIFGRIRHTNVGLNTVTCARHGAMLCVAVNTQGQTWRCPTCNEGAYLALGSAAAWSHLDDEPVGVAIDIEINPYGGYVVLRNPGE